VCKETLRLRDGLTVIPFDTSTLEPRYLVQRPDGGRFQVSARLADVIRAMQGADSAAEVCARLKAAWGREVSPDNLSQIAERFLRPHGLLADDETSGRPADRAGPLFVRLPLLSPRLLAPPTWAGQFLFTPFLAWAVVLMSLAIRYLVYAHIPAAAHELGRSLPWVPLLALLSILSHELGHVSACRHFGCTHGPIGVGIYAIFPVFYTDASDTWRLPRRARMAVDAAGIYFQLIFSIVLFGVYALWRWQPALTTLFIADGMMLVALNPILRFDGYWLFSDLIGVPNLRQRAADTLAFAGRRLIRRAATPRPDLLRLPAAEMALLGAYAVISNCLLLFMFGVMLFRYAPGLIANYPQLLSSSWAALQAGISQGDAALVLGAISRPITTTLALTMLILLFWRGGRWLSGRASVRKPRPAEVHTVHFPDV
jgi:putative peptide zinc metalloprotease protein